MTAREEYLRRRGELSAQLEALDARGSLLANLRSVAFLAGAGLALATTFGQVSSASGWWATGAGFALFAVLAVIHAKVIAQEKAVSLRRDLNLRGLARLDGTWRAFPDTGERFAQAEHPFAADLDVFGKASLFQRLDETATRAGQELLARWLSAPLQGATAQSVKDRQEAVAELAPLVDFRQALVTEARVAGGSRADLEKFLAWTEGPPLLAKIRWAFPLAHVLPLVTVALYLFAPEGAAALGLLLQLAVIGLTRTALGRLWAGATQGESGFVQFSQTFAAIDAQRFTAPLLRTLKAGTEAAGPKVSQRFESYGRVMGFAILKNAPQLHWLLNLLTLWDLHFLFRLEAWRVREAQGARAWFESLAQLEALSCLAAYALEAEGTCWPQLDDGPIHLEASGLKHPLLDEAVGNPVSLEGPGVGLVITGSNMSGKTTYLRAVGLAAVMAWVGLPVRAASMRVGRAQPFCSMRVKDSLERGVSYFYAEVLRIKTLVAFAQAHPQQTLFLLDELFMGTNARERQVASKAIVQLLLGAGGSGGITTHDLTMTELATAPGLTVRNVHFRDEVRSDTMAFDYTVREGVASTTNALKVLRANGVPVPEA